MGKAVEEEKLPNQFHREVLPRKARTMFNQIYLYPKLTQVGR